MRGVGPAGRLFSRCRPLWRCGQVRRRHGMGPCHVESPVCSCRWVEVWEVRAAHAHCGCVGGQGWAHAHRGERPSFIHAAGRCANSRGWVRFLLRCLLPAPLGRCVSDGS
eukprot:179904-Chlamydomonas_euryale.AAC.1